MYCQVLVIELLIELLYTGGVLALAKYWYWRGTGKVLVLAQALEVLVLARYWQYW